MKRSFLWAAIAALALGGVGTVQAQSGDPDRVDRQAALLNAALIENAFHSVERRIRVTDADNLWVDDWTGLIHPPSGTWWLSSWTERGLTARYCDGVLAVYAGDDELKGVGRDQRAVQVAPVAYGNGRTGLHLITRGSRLFRGAHGRGDGSLPGCMPIPSTTGDRAGLVLAVADPRLTTVDRRWETEDRTVSCPAPDTGTMTERRRIPIQVTALTNCPAATPNCNDLREFAPVPPAWPADCATRETMLSATPPGLPANAACTDWVRWRSNCRIVYAQAPPAADIPDPTITWETGPVHTWTAPCSCSCPPGDIVGGSCTEHWAQNTEWRVFVLRPGSPELRRRQPARVNGQPRLANTVSSCSCTTPPPPSCPAGQTGTPPNCTTPPPGQTCPAGQTGTPPNCTTPPPGQTCPAGQVGTPPNCTTPPPGQTCPAGQTGTPPNCTKPPKQPPREPDECEDGSCGDGGPGAEGDAEAEAEAEAAEDDSANEGFGGSSMGPPGSMGNANTPGVEDSNANGEGSGDGGKGPILLDLDGDGVELVPLEDSTAFFDINGDGYRERMAWVSADDGFLAYDKDGDGRIAEHDELSFVSYVPGARTDLEGLRHFDTDRDGQLDPDDADWSLFRVWQDLDQDGESDPGELRGLDEEGIESISLNSDGVERRVAGNTVFGEGRYVTKDGPKAFWDASLRVGERKE